MTVSAYLCSKKKKDTEKVFAYTLFNIFKGKK